MRTKFPYDITYEQTKNRVWAARAFSDKHLRVGQALVNQYLMSKELEDAIWEDDSIESVSTKIYQHYHQEGYQN